MHNTIIENQNALQRLFAQGMELQRNDEIDVEVKSGFVSYLCIRTYVYVESSVQIILREYVKGVTDDDFITNYINKQLRKHPALKRSELLKLVGNFSEEWKIKLRDSTKGRLGESLDSIVNNRNIIAHGDDVTISFAWLQNYFIDVQTIIELVYQICYPATQELATA